MRSAPILTLLSMTLLSAMLSCSDDDTGPTDSGVADAGMQPDVGPTGPLSIRIATWNVENFFDETDDPERGDETRTTSQVEGKMEGIASVLRDIDADFIALQEVETQELLQRLAEGPAADLDYIAWGLEDSFDGRGLDVGFLSRYEPSNVVSHLGEAFLSPDGMEMVYFTRDALEVFIEPQGYPMTIMVLHLRSMLDGGGDDHRLAEATQAREIVDRRLASGVERMMVAGDLNDFPGSDPLNALLDGPSLFDLTREVPSGERYSYVFRGMQQQLDYLMGNPLVDEARTEASFHRSAQADAVSDHDPVVVDLTFEP